MLAANMDKNYSYYILENVWKATGQEINTKIRIIKVPDYYPPIQEGEGPFNGMRSLKRNSSIYRRLASNGTKELQKVLNNIVVPKDFILTPPDKTYKEDFINVYLHVTKGRVKRGNVYGLHYFDPKKIRILKEEYYDKSTGIFKAKIEFYDKNTSKWIQKKASSTFFPKTWTPTDLFNECDFANSNKIKKASSTYVYSSKTISGIPVEIIIKNEKLTSIYPVIK